MSKYPPAPIALANYFRSATTDWDQTRPQMMLGGKALTELYLGEDNDEVVREFQEALKRTAGINTHWAKVAIQAAANQKHLFKTHRRETLAKYAHIATFATRYGDHFDPSDPDAMVQFRALLEITAGSDLPAYGVHDLVTTNSRFGEVLHVKNEPWFVQNMNKLSSRWKHGIPKKGRPRFHQNA